MGGPNSHSQKKGHSSPPLFGPCLLWPNGRPSQQLLSSCAKWMHTAFFDHATYRNNQLAGGYIAERRSFPYATSHRTALFHRLGSCYKLLTNQRRRVACSVDADRFSCLYSTLIETIRDVKRLSVYGLSLIFLVLVFEFQKSIIVSNLGLSS